MTYSVMSDLIRAEQKLQCELRGLPYTHIKLGLLLQLISQAEEEIQRRVRILRSFTPIDLGAIVTYANETDIIYVDESGVYYADDTDTLIYDLPDDYGDVTELVLNGEPVPYITPEEYYVGMSLRSSMVYTIVAQDGKHLLKLGPVAPLETDELIPVYYTTIRPYRERNITGDTNLAFPNDYQDLTKLGVMRAIFQDYWAQFEQSIESHIQKRNSGGLKEIAGANLGGVSSG